MMDQSAVVRPPGENIMKIVVVGGTGLVGSQTVARLRNRGLEVVAAAPSTGVDTITGAGLADALQGADVVIDVANAPSFDDQTSLSFFQTAGKNLLSAEADAGVKHHIALSVVGTERLQASGYFRAKLVQENLITFAKTPYTIVRATQFFEFMAGIADFSTKDNVVTLTTAAMQPIASADVAVAIADLVAAAPVNGIVEIGGPERAPLAEFVATWLGHVDDVRAVKVDALAGYFGILVDDDSLVPGPKARVMPTRYDDWLAAA
jgi:uncharacterized protein YbjT (DUF2867 family)